MRGTNVLLRGAVWGLRECPEGMVWVFEEAMWRQWDPLFVSWGAVRRSLWRGLREAPTSCPGSADARGLAAEVACAAAVEEGDPRATQGSPWPGSGSRHAPVQLEQLHGPGPAAPLPQLLRTGSRGGSTCTRGDSAEAPASPGPAPNLGSCAQLFRGAPRLGSGPPSSGPRLSCQVISAPLPAQDLPPA